MLVFPDVLLGWFGTVPQGLGVKPDAGPAGTDELANVTVAVAGRVVQNLLVMLCEQSQGIGFIQVAILAQGKYPAGAGVFAGLVAQRAVVEAGKPHLEVLVDQRQGVIKTGVAALQRRKVNANGSSDVHYLWSCLGPVWCFAFQSS